MLADLGGTVAASIPLGIAYGVILAATGTPLDQIEQALAEMPLESPFRLFSVAVGTGFSVLGGYVCARIARRIEYRLALAVAGLSQFVALLISGFGMTTGQFLLLGLLSCGATLFGARLGRERNRSLPGL